MKNRAKCKLCQCIIETFIANEFVSCKCGEITIGPDLYAKANDFCNFLRVDDEGNEIIVTYQEKGKGEEQPQCPKFDQKPTKNELLKEMDTLIAYYNEMPENALLTPVSHSDLLSVLLVISSLFKSI